MGKDENLGEEARLLWYRREGLESCERCGSSAGGVGPWMLEDEAQGRGEVDVEPQAESGLVGSMRLRLHVSEGQAR